MYIINDSLSVDHSGSEAETPVPTQFARNRRTRESRRRPERAAVIRAEAAAAPATAAAATAATTATDSAAAVTESSADSGSASVDAVQAVADSAEAGPSTSKTHDSIFESATEGKVEKRKRSQTAARKRSGPLHAPGTYVYDEVEAACSDGQYTCGSVLMPAGLGWQYILQHCLDLCSSSPGEELHIFVWLEHLSPQAACRLLQQEQLQHLWSGAAV
jgi:hypothetical protein